MANTAVKWTDTISERTGELDKVPRVNDRGYLDGSFFEHQGLKFIDGFTPQAGAEYPDTTNYGPGDFWIVNGLDSSGYTFTGGDLAGKVTYNSDLMILGVTGWTLQPSALNPDEYLLLSGGTMTGPLHNQATISSDAQPVNDKDLTRKDYVDNLVAGYLPLTGGTLTSWLNIRTGGPTINLYKEDVAAYAGFRIFDENDKNRFYLFSPPNNAYIGLYYYDDQGAIISGITLQPGGQIRMVAGYSEPVHSSDLTPRGYVENLIANAGHLPLTGGVITGSFRLETPGTSYLGAKAGTASSNAGVEMFGTDGLRRGLLYTREDGETLTIAKYMDSTVQGGVTFDASGRIISIFDYTVTGGRDLTTKFYVDDAVGSRISRDGDTMAAPLKGPAPSAPEDYVPKSYVDDRAKMHWAVISLDSDGATLLEGEGIAEVARIEKGVVRVRFTEPFASANYAIAGTVMRRNSGHRNWTVTLQGDGTTQVPTASECFIVMYSIDGTQVNEPGDFRVVFIGR